MIAACYSMDVHCDSRPCRGARYEGDSSVSQFTGETWAECKRLALKMGWKIKRDNQTASCPSCNGGSRRTPYVITQSG